MTRMETTRRMIQRGGNILSKGCKVSRIVLYAIIVAHIALLVGVFVDGRVAKVIQEAYEDNAVYRFLNEIASLDRVPMAWRAAIGCGAALLTHVVLLCFVKMISGMMDHLAAGGLPFDVAAAQRIRRYSYVMLALSLYNLPMGLIVFGLTLLFSYIIEYGAYIQQRADETNRIQEEMIVSFAEITENKSGQTGQHIKRVSEYARILAEQLGLGAEAVESIRIASTMHDVGKLLIPSEILEKPGKLTDEEYAVIQQHTTYGGQLLEHVEGEEMELSRTIALQHHERYDGRGYPAHLRGEDISRAGRIVAVADVYDALTSKRSYKDAWSEDDAGKEILRGRGTQFDPQVVDAFEAARDRILEVRRRFADEG